MTDQTFLIIFFAGFIVNGLIVFNLMRISRRIDRENGAESLSPAQRFKLYFTNPVFRILYALTILIGFAIVGMAVWHFA